MSLHSSDVQQGLYFGGGVGTAVIATILVLASMFLVKGDSSKKMASLVALFLSFAGNIMLLILIYSRDPIPNMDLAIAQTVTIAILLFMVILGMNPKWVQKTTGFVVQQTSNTGEAICSNINMIHGSAILMIAVQLNLLLLYKPFVELY